MIKTNVTCDFCEKECGENYVSIFLNSENRVIGKHEFCGACYSRMRMTLNHKEVVKEGEAK